MAVTTFDRLDKAFQSGGIDETLSQLAAHLRVEKKYHELFETRKMQLRRRLGLSLFSQDTPPMPPALRDEFERGLLEVCREVGMLLLKNHQIREAWMYLRTLDEQESVRQALNELKVPEDHNDELIELLFHEGLDPIRGYRLVLAQHGTCNAITALDGRISGLSPVAKTETAGALIDHIYEELLTNVQGHIEREEGAAPESDNLSQLIGSRSWLTKDGNYHVDTSHLSSVVRLARYTENPTKLQRAQELAVYGKTLDESLQYPGTAPFEDMFSTHELYFAAILGQRVEEAINFFRDKAESTDAYYEGTQAAEIFVELLLRCAKGEEAIKESVRLLPPGSHTTGLAPALIELSRQCGQFGDYLRICQEQQDVLGYVSGLALRQECSGDLTATKNTAC